MGEAHEPRSGCPINATIEVFGDRWSLLVLRDIVFGDRRYFREIHYQADGARRAATGRCRGDSRSVPRYLGAAVRPRCAVCNRDWSSATSALRSRTFCISA
jgi:hypothetical protein